jgi:hypothetical protein
MSEPSLAVRIGDDDALLALVPLASDMPTGEDQRMVLAAYRIRGMLTFRSRRSEAARIREEVVTALRDVRPRTVVMAFEGADGASRRRVDRIARHLTRDISVTATNAVGADTTVIGLVIMSGRERDLAASCVRHVALEPPERGDGLVFHAVDLGRANIYELIAEAIV